jgi:hypothetical protein
VPRRPTNFAPEMVRFVSPFPPGEAVAEEGRFVPGFPLRERLDGAVGMYLALTRRRLPTPRERRERLDSIRAAAAAKDRARLDLLLESTGGDLPGLGMVGAPFASVLAAVEAAHPAVNRKHPPVSGDGALRILMVDLAEIWREGTGRRPTVTVDPYTDPPSHGGPFIRFAVDVVRRLDLKKKRKNLAVVLAQVHERARESESP